MSPCQALDDFLLFAGNFQGFSRVTGCSKFHGSGRVGSGQEVFKITRVGLGRIKRFSNIAGRFRSGGFQTSRIGSGREVTKSSRIGSGHDLQYEERVSGGSGQ